jgi:tetratricopeptide (TPR) repeat protein
MESNVAEKMWVRSCANAYIGNIQQAIDEAEQAINILQEHDPNSDNINFYWARIALWHTQLGNQLAADSIVNRLSVDTKQFDYPDSMAFWYARAFVSLEIGKYDTSIVYWKDINNADPGYFPDQLYLGRCLLGAGKLGKAVTTLEKTMNTYSDSRGSWPHLSTLGHYWLALAYEASGWNNKAVEQYESFLDIWKDADEGLKPIEDAKERLERLKSA